MEIPIHRSIGLMNQCSYHYITIGKYKGFKGFKGCGIAFGDEYICRLWRQHCLWQRKP